MASGDIIAATISGASPHEGWVVLVEIEGWSAATGLAVVGGWTSPGPSTHGNNPNTDTEKGWLTVVSQGYSESGGTFTLGTRNRTVYLTRAVQKAYPDNADIDTTTSGSNLIVKVALSDYVYAGDNTGAGNSGTAPTLSALAGLFTSNLGSSAAVTNLTCTNSSTKAYPLVKAAWLDPPGGRIGSTYSGRLSCAHPYGIGQPVVGVLFTITDEDANIVNNAIIVPSSEASTRFPTLPQIQCYKSTASTSTLSDGKGITVVAKAYPYIGKAASIFDSTSETDTHRRNRVHRLDRAGSYRNVYAYVNEASPAGTPVVSTTAATARASPYGSIWDAANDIRTYINTNYAEANSLEGSFIRLMDNAGAAQDFVWGRDYFAAGLSATYCFAIVQPDPLNTALVRLRDPSTTQNILCTNLRFEGVTICPVSASQANFFASAGAADWIVFYQCDLISDGTSTSTIYDTIENTSSYECQCTGWYTNVWRTAVWPNFTGIVTTTMATNFGCLMGFRVTAVSGGNVYQSGTEPTFFATSATSSNGYIAFFENTTGQSPWTSIGHKPTNLYIGHGISRRGNAGSQPQILISADLEDCFVEHVSVVLQRANWENEAASNLVFDRLFVKAFAAPYSAYKYDVFGANATITGGWPAHYGVGWEAIYNGNNTFPPNFDGLDAVLRTDQADFAQVDTADDATPTTGSLVLNLIRSGRATSAYDITGRAIPNDGTGAAGCLQIEPASTSTTKRVARVGRVTRVART